ncbi:MAG: pitrilysin family protein [Streptococcus minor]|nr:pitrilysin family protein [Streptococcus minor]
MKYLGLEKKNYPYLESPLYKGRLTNGLTVYLQPKPGFKETYGMMTVGFGAVDTVLKLKDKPEFVTYPAGMAHFLEHKLFEMRNGKDVLQEFSKLGADANAYTSFYQTSYLFSTTREVLQNLALLQDFVHEVSFTEESVEREKAIIAQEIEMYQDDPESRLYNEILASLYPGSPLQEDIAGSVHSIQDITVQSLNENFQAFYQPQNMTLFLVGNVELEATWKAIQERESRREGRDFSVERQMLTHQPILSHRTSQMVVASPKLAIGIRGNKQLAPDMLYRFRLSLSLLFSMLFGWTSMRCQSLYKQGKIDNSFSFHLEVRPEYHFFVLTMDTKEPVSLSKNLRRAIQQFASDPDVSTKHLEIVKRKAYGDFIASLNSLHFTASHFMQYLSDDETIFDLPEIIESIDLEEVLATGHQFLSDCDMTDFIIFPK